MVDCSTRALSLFLCSPEATAASKLSLYDGTTGPTARSKSPRTHPFASSRLSAGSFEQQIGIPQRWLGAQARITVVALNQESIQALLFILGTGTSSRMKELVKAIAKKMISKPLKPSELPSPFAMPSSQLPLKMDKESNPQMREKGQHHNSNYNNGHHNHHHAGDSFGVDALLGAAARQPSEHSAEETSSASTTATTTNGSTKMEVDTPPENMPRQKRQAAMKSRQMLSNGLHNAIDDFGDTWKPDRKRSRKDEELSIRIRVPLNARKLYKLDQEDDLREPPPKKRQHRTPSPVPKNRSANELANLEEEALSILTPSSSSSIPSLGLAQMPGLYPGYNPQLVNQMAALYAPALLGSGYNPMAGGYSMGGMDPSTMALFGYNPLLSGISTQDLLLHQRQQQMYQQHLLEAHLMQQQQQLLLQQHLLAQQQPQRQSETKEDAAAVTESSSNQHPSNTPPSADRGSDTNIVGENGHVSASSSASITTSSSESADDKPRQDTIAAFTTTTTNPALAALLNSAPLVGTPVSSNQLADTVKSPFDVATTH